MRTLFYRLSFQKFRYQEHTLAEKRAGKVLSKFHRRSDLISRLGSITVAAGIPQGKQPKLPCGNKMSHWDNKVCKNATNENAIHWARMTAHAPCEDGVRLSTWWSHWKRLHMQSSHPMQCTCTFTCTGVGAHTGWPFCVQLRNATTASHALNDLFHDVEQDFTSTLILFLFVDKMSDTVVRIFISFPILINTRGSVAYSTSLF